MNSSTLPALSWFCANKSGSFINELQSNTSFREKHKLFFIEGVRNFIQAVNNDYELSAIYFSEKLLVVPSARQMLRKLRRSGLHCFSLRPEEFRQISTTKQASGIAAIAKIKSPVLHKTPLKSGLFWIVLDKIHSNGNFGTLIRSSEAIGGAGFILLNRNVDPYSPDVLRASMGSLFNQKFIQTSVKQLNHWIHRHKAQLIGTSIDAKINFQEFNYPTTPLIFLGEERKGLTENQKYSCQHLVRIPMVGKADSLNLGVAGSLLMYEIARKRL